MTFADDHKPHFDRYLPSNGQQSQELAMTKSDASKHTSGMKTLQIYSMLGTFANTCAHCANRAHHLPSIQTFQAYSLIMLTKSVHPDSVLPKHPFFFHVACASGAYPVADPLGDEVRSMLRYLPTEVRDAVIMYFLASDEPTGNQEKDEASYSRSVSSPTHL